MRSFGIFVASAAVSATPIIDQIREEVEFKKDLSCWRCLAGSFKYYLPNEEMFARLDTNSKGYCVKELPEVDPSDEQAEDTTKKDWTYLDGAADNRDWALTACPSQASRCGASTKIDLESDEEKEISMEADEDLNEHCSWIIHTDCSAPGILPLKGEDDDWFLMYTEYSKNFTEISEGGWPLEMTSNGLERQIPYQGKEDAYLGGEIPMIEVSGIPMPGSQAAQFFRYRNEVIKKENDFRREQAAKIEPYKKAVKKAIDDAVADRKKNWFTAFLGNPFAQQVQAPMPFELDPEYTTDETMTKASRDGSIRPAEKAGLGQYTSGTLIPSLGGKSFGVFGQGNPLRDPWGHPIEGSEVRQGSKLPQDGPCNFPSMIVTAIPKKAGAKMSMKAGAYPWGQLFVEIEQNGNTYWKIPG